MPVKRIIQEWDIGPLLELSRSKLSWENYCKLRDCIQAIWWKLEIAEYHIDESDSAIPRSLPETQDKAQAAGVMVLRHMSGDPGAEIFGHAQFLSEAHAIAAAQALHSIADISAALVYLALQLDQGAMRLPEYKWSVWSVIRAMEASGVLPDLITLMKDAANSESYRYLRAYVNTTKHVSLVDRNFTLGIAGPDQNRFGLHLAHFTYVDARGTEQWPGRWLEDFLHGSHTHMSKWAVDVGRQLEAHMRRAA